MTATFVVSRVRADLSGHDVLEQFTVKNEGELLDAVELRAASGALDNADLVPVGKDATLMMLRLSAYAKALREEEARR